ncbi:hypothetical protein F2P79_024710 [Pimephales promelas]|nr:hypothetical protein F2P79_024710 [Pimephales promelas]
MGKKGDLSDFERGMIVGARRAGLSISETANLLGFSRTTISRVYREWSEKEKTSSERQFCGLKCLVDARGQRRMARLVRADRRATVTQITTRYNQGGQKSISERTAGGWCHGVGIFSWHSLGPLVPIEHRCNATAYLSIVADHVHPFMTTMYPTSDGYFQQDNAPCHKAGIISDWFLEHDNEFAVLKWPPQSPDLNPIQHLWDVVEREIRIMDVQPTNLRQLCDAIMTVVLKGWPICLIQVQLLSEGIKATRDRCPHAVTGLPKCPTLLLVPSVSGRWGTGDVHRLSRSVQAAPSQLEFWRDSTGNDRVGICVLALLKDSVTTAQLDPI